MKISVIIPTYNYAHFIGEAVESVRSQTFRDTQIIVVDDESTDDTLDVLARIDDPRLEVIRTARRGVSGAQNVGMKHACGDFIAFLDADDRWLPTKLERQLEVILSEPDVVAVFTNFVRFNERGVFPRDQFSFFPELATTETRPSAAGGGRIILGNGFAELVSFAEVPAWVQTLLFRADALKGLQFHESDPTKRGDFDFCEDMHFCLRAYRRGVVAYLEESLVEVRRHGDNLTKTLSDMPQANLSALQLLETEDLDQVQRQALRRRLGKAHVAVGVQNVADGEPAAALRAYFRALGHPGARLSALKNLGLLAGHVLLPSGIGSAAT